MISITQEEIMRDWGDAYVPLVSIKCLVYNHENYVSQALDGFLMQKTNFPFEVIIHDDASTDDSAKIIKEYEEKYPRIIKPIYESENQYSKHDGSLGRAIDPFLKGKYIALCEGDDYWIDENKLQMQVDFLEGNPDYGLCYTKARQFIQKRHAFSKMKIGSAVADFEDLLRNGNRIPTLTTVFRKKLFEKYGEEICPQDKGWLMGDYPMWLYFAHESKVKFLNTVSAVYRVLENSASHSTDIQKKYSFKKSSYELRLFFAKKYKEVLPAWNEEKEMFNIYYYQLLDSYTHKKSALLYDSYLKIHRKSMRERIIIFVSRNFVLFKVFYFFAWIKMLRC